MFNRICGVLLLIATLICGACSKTEAVASVAEIPADWSPVPDQLNAATDALQDEQIQKLFKQRAQRCLYISGSKKTADLRSEFDGKLIMASYDLSDRAPRVTEAALAQGQSSGGLLVVLYGKHSAYTGPMEQALFIYREEWPAIFMPAVSMSEPWFCAAFLHELAHASEHSERMRTGASQSMAENYMEEVRTHELEREVLNILTHNAYVPALETYLEGTNKKSLQVAIDSMLGQKVPPGLEPVIGLFPITSDEENTLRFAQIAIDLMFLSVEQKGGTATDKMLAYNKLRMRN